MFLKHRIRTLQGTFYSIPDYAVWYGWSEMVRDVTKIEESADQMKSNKSIKASK